LIYDASSGEIRDDRKFMTMLEDFWLPRREGGRGTEVTTLPGGQTLGQMDDVLYFQKKFLNALNVPISRLNSDALFSVGRATEITRDELKFAKFVVRLRARFSVIFSELLKKQLVLKQIMSIEEWEAIEADVQYDYARDNYFTELKAAEIEQNRINLARGFQDVVGKYYSHMWVRKNVLRQTDDGVKTMDEQIMEEEKSGDPRWINPMIVQNEQMADAYAMQKMSDEQQVAAQQQGQQGGGNPSQPHTPSSGHMGVHGWVGGGSSNQPQVQQIDPLQEKVEQVRQAMIFIKHMKEKGKANRTMQEESKYKSAIQIVARNKDLIQQHASINN